MKRTLSFIMVLAMVLSMVPAVYAEAAEAVVITSGTDVAVTVAEPATYTWTAEANGTLTVTMGATSPGWRYTISDAAGNTVGLPKNGSTEKSADFELVAGTAYTFRATGWSSSAWEETAATITYSLSFVASADDSVVEKAEYEVSDTALVLGDNTLTLLETAVNTIYVYEPTETGVFTFTAPEGAIVGYWGAGSWFLTNPNSTTNTYEWTCTGVGQSAYIGVSGVEGSFNLNVAKTGDYTVVEIPIVVYENKATLETFTLPEGATLGGYIDVTAETTHTAVLGDDGYYHLNSADGEIILVDMNYQDIVLSNALNSDRPVMYAYTTDENGNDVKYDIGAAVKAYEAVMDANGYYPLTEDLILFYDVYASGAGVYSYYVTSSYNEENVWMYCMRTATFPEVTEPEVSEPDPSEPEESEPDETEPDETEPEASKPSVSDNVVFSVVTSNETAHYETGSEIVTAIAAITGSATVTLYQDIDLSTSYITVAEGQNIILDLNGCTLATKKTSGGVISVNGTLTVQDTSAEGDGLITNTATSSDRGVLVNSSGNLIFNSGNITTKTQGVRVDGGKMTMTGGSIDATQYGVYGGSTANVAISGGTVSVAAGTFYHTVYGGGSAIMTITGGYFNGGALNSSGLIGGVSGGYYTTAPNDSMLATDCTVEDNDDAVYLYKVVDPNAVTEEPEEPALGSEENPVLIYNQGASINATAGQTVYCQSYVGGMIMTISGESDFSVVYNGNTYSSENGTLTTTEINGSMMAPVTFTLVNGDADATYTVSFTAPVGSMDNADTLVLDYNYADIAAGSQGYYYTWTAEEDGILTITMPESIGWTYTINNLTSNSYGDTQWSDSDPVVNPATTQVAAGDVLQIIVNTYDPADMWNNPAAELSIYASFSSLPGTENNPILFTDKNAETSAIEDQMTVPAGASQYYTGRVGGLTMTVTGENISINYNGTDYTPVDGVITINVEAVGFFAPSPVFVVTNSGDAEATYDVVFTYPVGSFENPAKLLLDTNAVSVAEGGAGYYYTWTAEEDGTLTIEMTSSNWSYVINNNTAYVYGSNHASTDDPVVSSESIKVSAGDEIQIVIGTADYAAADVTLVASFKDNSVAKINDVTYIDLAAALAAAKPNETVELIADATADYVIVTPGVTLDLGSYTLTANYVIGLQGSYVTANAEGATEGVAGGKLVVPQDKIALSSAAPNADGDWKVLPVWMDGYYIFAKAQIYNPSFTVNAENNSATVSFNPTFNKYFKENVFNDGCEDNDVSIIISVSYMEGDIKVTKEYYYTTPMVQQAMNNLPLTATMTECDTLTDLVFSISIVTEAGVEVSSQDYTYNDYL